MFRIQILVCLLMCVASNLEAVSKIDASECIEALQKDEEILIRALEKMHLPNTSNPEKMEIHFWERRFHNYLFKYKESGKRYKINAVHMIDAANIATAFRNLWHDFPTTRDRLIAIADEISVMIQDHNFSMNNMDKMDKVKIVNGIYNIIIDRLLQVYNDVRDHSRNPSQVIETSSDHREDSLIKSLYFNLLSRFSLTSDEQKFRDEGYSDIYIEGFDSVSDYLQLAESLRTRPIDPYTSHIPEIADLIDIHIDFIRRGIVSQESPDKFDRLEQLELLKVESQSRKELKQVTYRWWINFNLRLSILVTPFAMRKSDIYYRSNRIFTEVQTNNDLERFYQWLTLINYEKSDTLYDYYLAIYSLIDLLDQFPQRILIPIRHNLGIMPINKMYGTGVHLIGLNNQPIKFHNRTMNPYSFFLHDINHALYRKVDNSQILKRLQQKLEGLSGFRKKAVEYIYFEVTHENAHKLESLEHLGDIKKIITSLIEEYDRTSNNSIDHHNNRINHNYVKSFLPFLPDSSMSIYLFFLLNDKYLMNNYSLSFLPNNSMRIYNSIGEFIKEGSDVFMNLILEVHKELGIIDNE